MTKMTQARSTRQTRTIEQQFAVREEDGQRRIEGYFSVFGPEYQLWPGASESIDPHAFDGCMGDDVRVLTNHDTTRVLGRTRAGTAELRVDEHGLWGSALINEADTDATNTWARVARGDVSQASFGFDILDEEETVREDGSVHWTIKAVRLYEVSVVTFPAYTDTEIAARRADYATIQQRRRDAWRAQNLARLKRAHRRRSKDA